MQLTISLSEYGLELLIGFAFSVNPNPDLFAPSHIRVWAAPFPPSNSPVHTLAVVAVAARNRS